MATNYENLTTALQARVTDLGLDDIPESKALILIDQYVAALQQQATESASNVTAYSISGRSVTKGSVRDFTKRVADLEGQLFSILYGSTTYADFRDVFSVEDTSR